MLKKSLVALCALMLLVPGMALSNRTARLEGTITAINRSGNPPTITISRGNASAVLRLASNTRVELGNRRGTLNDLTVGQQVRVEYNPSTLQALTIAVQGINNGGGGGGGDDDDDGNGGNDSDDDDDDGNGGSGDDDDDDGNGGGNPGQDVTVNGTIVSASANELVIRPNGSSQNLVLRITDRTRFEISGQNIDPSFLSRLAGLPVRVVYDPATNEVEVIRIQLRFQVLRGTITAINGNQITLRTGRQTIPLTLDDSVPIFFRGQPVSVGDLQVGDVVALQVQPLSGVRFIVIRADLEAQPRQVAGVLTAVGSNTITVRPFSPNQAPVTLTIDDQTRLKVNGRTSTLAQLATLLAQANASGRQIQVTAQYLQRGSFTSTTSVNANVNFRGGRR